MKDIEDRLRDGYQAVERALRPETIRPPVLPDRPRRQTARFMPLAAAAAVVVVIAGAVTVPRLLAGSPAPAATATPGIQIASPLARYLADLRGTWIEVRDPATGKVLSKIPPPAGYGWQGIAAIEGGTKFVLETAGDPCVGDKPFKLYLLTPGKPDGLKPLMTLPGFLLEFTASADGSTLAYLTSQCKGGRPSTEIAGVVRNGTTRDWTMPSSLYPGSLSLSADGSELGYISFAYQAPRGSAWVLPTSSPPGSLSRWSHHIFVPTQNGQQAEGLALSPDGRSAYLLTVRPNQSVETHTLSAYNTATSTRIRTLHAWTIANRILGIAEVSIAIDGIHALILGMHLNSIDEVNLATGAAGWFHQLRDGTGDVMAIAW